MKYFLIIVALLFSTVAEAQTSRNPCYNTGQGINGLPNCIGVGTASPLPVTLGATPGTSTVGIDQTTANANDVKAIGGGSIATAQVSLTATAVQVAAARANRLAITVTVAGTAVDTFCGATGVTITTGDLIVGTKGASKTYSTGAAIFCVTGTTGTVSVAETF